MSESIVKSYFQDKSKLMGTALVLLLLSFFLINWGVRNVTWAYWIGLILLAVGMLIPPITRYISKSEEDNEQSNGQ